LGGRAKQPSALSRALSRALNITVATVIAGQVKPIRTTVEQPGSRGIALEYFLGRARCNKIRKDENQNTEC